MALDTPTELINSVKGRFAGKLAGKVFGSTKTIKNFILKKGGELDKLSNNENHWLLKTDPSKVSSEENGWDNWEDYINGINTFTPTASWSKDQQWNEKIKGDILSCLARLVVFACDIEQDNETDPVEKKKWWDTLNAYITTYNTPIEQRTYADDGSVFNDIKGMINKIRTVSTTTPPVTGTGWDKVGFCQKYLGNDPDDWKKVGLCQRYYG